MDIVTLIQMAVAAGLAATVVVVLFTYTPLYKTRLSAWGPTLAIAAGFIAAYWVLWDAPDLIPEYDAKQRLPHVAVALALLAPLLSIWSGKRSALVWLGFGGASVVLGYFALRGAMKFKWDSGDSAKYVFLFAAGLVALCFVASVGTRNIGGRIRVLGAATLAGLAAPTLLFSDSALLAQVTGNIAFAGGAVWLVSLIAKDRVDTRGVAPMIAGLLWTLWFFGYEFAAMPTTVLLLLCATIAIVPLAIRHLPATLPKRNALVIATIFVPLLLALGLGAKRYVDSSKPAQSDTTSAEDDDY